MLDCTPAVQVKGLTRFQAAMATTTRMPRHMLNGELNVSCSYTAVLYFKLLCSYYYNATTDVKMDWCNTKIDGKELDPKDQYPQMVN